MSGAGDAFLDPRLSFDSDHNTRQLETNAGNVDHDRGFQGNRENEVFRKEDIDESSERDEGPSRSSDRLIPEDFHSMEPEVIVSNSSRKQGIMWRIVFILLGVLIGILLSMLWRTAILLSDSKAPASTSSWRGWKSIEYTFIFGDSWTDTAFDPSKTQPSPANPLGNPAFPGSNSANATNWVGFLATKYNYSFVETYNLAAGGATLDNSIVQGYPFSVNFQMYNLFMPHYGPAHNPKWNASNSLFIMFAGVVDLIMMNGIREEEKLNAVNGNLTIMYDKLLDSMYGAGARNFLILNMPPLERCWQPGENGPAVSKKLKSDGAVYNHRIQNAAEGLKGRFKDTNVFLLDIEKIFNAALDNVKFFPQTSGILNTTTPCAKYQGGTPTEDYLDPRCGIPVNQYFWLNGLHPTYPIHDVMAEHIVKLLDSGPNIY